MCTYKWIRKWRSSIFIHLNYTIPSQLLLHVWDGSRWLVCIAQTGTEFHKISESSVVALQSQWWMSISFPVLQDVCSAFRPYVRDGRLGCTRENDPVLGPDGRTHGNKCAMCAELLWVSPSLSRPRWGRGGLLGKHRVAVLRTTPQRHKVLFMRHIILCLYKLK